MIRIALLAAVAVIMAACSVITPRLDEATGTTLAQRCVDYRAAVAAYTAISMQRELSEAEAAFKIAAESFVTVNCPVVPTPKPEV